MARLRNSVTRFLGRRPKRDREGQGDAVDRKETERLNAEYTGSFARNAGQELGVLPPRYGRK
jgi:hypothetical protein